MAKAQKQAAARRKAMESFMRAKRLSAAEWAREAGMPNANPIYNLLNGHSSSLSQVTLEKLARAAKASVSEIFGEQIAVEGQAAVLAVRVQAASGAWRASYEVPGKSDQVLPIPPGVSVDEAVQIVDGHASLIYPASTIVGIQSIASLGRRGLLDGDRVLLHRVRGDRHEVTVRQVTESGGKNNRSADLVYASADKRYGATVAVPNWPYEGQFWEIEGDRLQIRGRVIMGLLMDND